MSPEPSFRDLLQRVRAGDQQAAAELVRQYEPAIRREVRLRLTDGRLRRVLDTSDVCQLVLKSFFVRAALGQFEVSSPAQLLALLARMARNKLGDERKKEMRDQRGGRMQKLPLPQDSEAGAGPFAEPRPSPAEQVAGRELLAQVLQRLSADERQLAELKAQGHSWPEIAARLGGTPEARRKQYDRAVQRVLRELDLEDESRA